VITLALYKYLSKELKFKTQVIKCSIVIFPKSRNHSSFYALGIQEAFPNGKTKGLESA